MGKSLWKCRAWIVPTLNGCIGKLATGPGLVMFMRGQLQKPVRSPVVLGQQATRRKFWLPINEPTPLHVVPARCERSTRSFFCRKQ
jgi:hypothetical protein